MNQQKIGKFLKELRKEKNMTQEQFAEVMGVSNRSVSRWENGTNLPDIDILIQMADYYEVDLREMLDGERKEERMDKNTEETVLKVADYSNHIQMVLTRRMHWFFIAGAITLGIYFILEVTGIKIVSNEQLNDFLRGFSLGISWGTLIVGILFTSKYMGKIREWKLKMFQEGKNV